MKATKESEIIHAIRIAYNLSFLLGSAKGAEHVRNVKDAYYNGTENDVKSAIGVVVFELSNSPGMWGPWEKLRNAWIIL